MNKFRLVGVSRRYASHAYQKTLNLPRSTFPVRSNLDLCVSELIPRASQDVYNQQLDEFLRTYKEISSSLSHEEKLKYIEEKLFVLHDGPPYANGDLHLGHALNKILKDIINRYQLAQGKYVFYKPGWDCHGLPIELKAIKQSVKSDNLKPCQVRSIASSCASEAMERQKNQFKQLAILTNWDDPYFTMQKDFEIDQLKIFRKLYTSGIIRRQNKPVYWSIESKTALAESELEYNDDHTSTSAFVKFPLSHSSMAFLKHKLSITTNDAIHCLIWTTTPWTLLANQAICYNERLQYVIIRSFQDECNFLVSQDLLTKVFPNISSYRILAAFNGSLLKDLKYQNPLISGHNGSKAYPLINGIHVTDSTGTGLVHTAPGHGSEDYLIGLNHNLPIFSPVDHKGNYILSELPKEWQKLLHNQTTGEGLNVLSEETLSIVLSQLQNRNMLHAFQPYKHSYPYDWRSKKPTIIRSTPQWFADLSHLKKTALDSLKDVKFYPSRGGKRLASFIKNRNEWCISRQRFWGIPIIYFQAKENPDEILCDVEILDFVIKRIEEIGIEQWFMDEEDIKNWLPEKYAAECGRFRKSKDTLDVWFDSGSSWSVIINFYKTLLGLQKEEKLELPFTAIDVYLEGSDQHRGWFQSSLLTYAAFTETSAAPFKSVITHGFILDEDGIKMSKSIGNTISPNDIIKGNQKLKLPALGIDGMRYLMAQNDFTNDISIGPTILNRTSESMKGIRLMFKFLLSNLNFNENTVLLPIDSLRPIDKYTISRLTELLTQVKICYESNNFSKMLSMVQYHLNNELSSLYFDISKDSLYSDSLISLKRNQIQTTFFHILNAYRAMLSPILPLLVQEAWDYIPESFLIKNKMNKSPMVLPWPNFSKDCHDGRDLMNSFENNELKVLRTFKDQLNMLTAEGIAKPPELSVKIMINDDKSVPFSETEICDILQAANVEIVVDTTQNRPSTPPDDKNFKLQIEKSERAKCPRCWKHTSSSEDELCQRCTEVLLTSEM